MEAMPRKHQPLQNSKTPKERAKAKQDLDELFAVERPAKYDVSHDGKKKPPKLSGETIRGGLRFP